MRCDFLCLIKMVEHEKILNGLGVDGCKYIKRK